MMALLIHSPETSIAPQIAKNPNPNLSKLHSFKPYTKGNNKAIGSKRGVKISCKVKDFGVLNVGLDQNVKRGARHSKEEEEKQNYYVNLGYAIRTLREEFPDLFYRELSFDIYRFSFLSFGVKNFMIFCIMVVEHRRRMCKFSAVFFFFFFNEFNFGGVNSSYTIM